MIALDIALAIGGAWLTVGIAWRLLLPGKARHVWGELDSASVAYLFRRRR